MYSRLQRDKLPLAEPGLAPETGGDARWVSAKVILTAILSDGFILRYGCAYML